jgi:hypothetical protein
MAQESALLPESKKFSQRGFNYTHSDNIIRVYPENKKVTYERRFSE